MSSYFQCYNGDNVLQIDDTFVTKVLSSRGKISGCSCSAGNWYGLITDTPTSFRINYGTIYILPQVIFGGHIVTYVTTDNVNDNIEFFQWVNASSISKMEHGAGLEIYDSSGKLVFTSSNKTGNVSSTYLIQMTNTSMNNAHNAYEQIFTDSHWTKEVIIAMEGSVLPLISPCFGEALTWRDMARWQYVAGYTFTGNTISTQESLTKIAVNNLAGYGNIDQISRIYDTWHTGSDDFQGEWEEWTGISACDYMFNIVS